MKMKFYWKIELYYASISSQLLGLPFEKGLLYKYPVSIIVDETVMKFLIYSGMEYTVY